MTEPSAALRCIGCARTWQRPSTDAAFRTALQHHLAVIDHDAIFALRAGGVGVTGIEMRKRGALADEVVGGDADVYLYGVSDDWFAVAQGDAVTPEARAPGHATCARPACQATATWTDRDGREWCEEHGFVIAVLSPDVVSDDDEHAQEFRSAIQRAIRQDGVARLRPARSGEPNRPHTEHDQRFVTRLSDGELYEFDPPADPDSVGARWRDANEAPMADSGPAAESWMPALAAAIANNESELAVAGASVPCSSRPNCGASSVALYVSALIMRNGGHHFLWMCADCERAGSEQAGMLIRLGLVRRICIRRDDEPLPIAPREVMAAVLSTPPTRAGEWLLQDARESVEDRKVTDWVVWAYDRAIAVAVNVGAVALAVDGPPLPCHGGLDNCESEATAVYVSSPGKGRDYLTAQCTECERSLADDWEHRLRHANCIRIALGRGQGPGRSGEGSERKWAGGRQTAPMRRGPDGWFRRRIGRLLGQG